MSAATPSTPGTAPSSRDATPSTPAMLERSPSAPQMVEKQNAAMAHKGHRNVGYRAMATIVNSILTLCVLYQEDDARLSSFIFALQIISAITLWIQWRTGRPSMFLYRAVSSVFQALFLFRQSICGKVWFDDVCNDTAWSVANSRPLRIFSFLAALRQIANAASLALHWRFPHRMFRGRGNEQLFWRGVVHLAGVPLNLIRFIWKIAVLAEDPGEVDVTVNLLRAVGPVLCSAITLFNQWWYTKKGFTGHDVSDAWERDMDPATDSVVRRVRVRIVSAKGLRDADWLGKSDPYCVCKVEGRPESSWQTAVVYDCLSPVWEETRVLLRYHKQDSIVFTIYDYDQSTWFLVQLINKLIGNTEDFLGTATLTSNEVHANDGERDLVLDRAGKGIVASLKVEVEVLHEEAEVTSTVEDPVSTTYSL